MSNPTTSDQAAMARILGRLEDTTFKPEDGDELRLLLRPYYATARFMPLEQLVRAARVEVRKVPMENVAHR